MATITAAQPMGRFGVLDIGEDGKITNFKEKKRKTAAGSMPDLWYWNLRSWI